jgi:hypothetical protein
MKPLPENGPAASRYLAPSALQMLGLLPMKRNGPAVPFDGTRVEVSRERTMVARGGLDSGDFGEDGVGEWLLLSRFLHL